MSTKRMAEILQVLSLFLLIDIATDAQAATYSFKSFDGPGATNTFAYSINNSGQVTGSYDDASGNHGFVYSYGDGKFTSLDAPGATARFGTFAWSINDSGQVTGFYVDASHSYHGFVYSPQVGPIPPTYTTLDAVPGAKYTDGYSINASGQVTGAYRDASFSRHGFVYSPQVGPIPPTYTILDAIPGARYTEATSINASGKVAGSYGDALGDHGFVYSDGKFTSFGPPDAEFPFILGLNINNSGQVTGAYRDASYAAHGFVYSYSDDKFTPLDVPGATGGTLARSINDSGQVTGYYNDASYSSTHSFIYSDGTFTPLDVPGATNTFAYSINASGQVAGGYVDASGFHGFIATPITPFSAFNITRLIIDQNRGALFLWSTFALGKDSNGKDSNGINPAKEDVTLKIADFTMTIPAGSFHKDRYLPLFTFAGQIDNVWIEALITPLGRNRFGFQALAYGAQLGETNNPVPVELTIGDDGGTTTTNARTH